MPNLFASGNETIFYYESNITPPKSVQQWTALIAALAQALIDRYGAPLVRTWIFEVWSVVVFGSAVCASLALVALTVAATRNEPNCGFWSGTMKQYYALYAETARALKGVDAALLVGGPVTCQTAYLGEFLQFVQTNGVPCDFVTSHLYPSDPNIVPPATFASTVADAAQLSAAHGLPFFLSEYNAGLDNVDNMLDTSYAAAFVARQVALLQGAAVDNLVGYSYWSFRC